MTYILARADRPCLEVVRQFATAPYPTATTLKEAGKVIAKVNLRYEIFERAHVMKRTGFGSPDFSLSGFLVVFLYFSSIHFSLEVNDKSASRDIRIAVSITFIIISRGRFLNFVKYALVYDVWNHKFNGFNLITLIIYKY